MIQKFKVWSVLIFFGHPPHKKKNKKTNNTNFEGVILPELFPLFSRSRGLYAWRVAEAGVIPTTAHIDCGQHRLLYQSDLVFSCTVLNFSNCELLNLEININWISKSEL